MSNQWQIDRFSTGWVDRKTKQYWWGWTLREPRSWSEVNLTIYPKETYILNWPISLDLCQLDQNTVKPLGQALGLDQSNPAIEAWLWARHRDDFPSEVEDIFSRDDWQCEVNHTADLSFDLSTSQGQQEFKLILDQKLTIVYAMFDFLPRPHTKPGNYWHPTDGTYGLNITSEPEDIQHHGYATADWSTDLDIDLTPEIARWILQHRHCLHSKPRSGEVMAQDLCSMVNRLKQIQLS